MIRNFIQRKAISLKKCRRRIFKRSRFYIQSSGVNVNNRIWDTSFIVLDVNRTTKLYQQEGILVECQPPACLQSGLQSELV